MYDEARWHQLQLLLLHSTGDAEKPLQTDLHHKAHIATIILIAQIHLRHIDAWGYLGGVIHTGRGRASFTLNALHTQTFIAKASGREQDSRCQINFAGSSSAIAYIADKRGASV